MIICEDCIKEKYPEFPHIDELSWAGGKCQTCLAVDKPVSVVAPQILEGKESPWPAPKERPGIVAEKIEKPSVKKQKYKYLLLNWNDEIMVTGKSEMQAFPHFIENKEELIDTIKQLVFKDGHEDLDVYELTPLLHKAEIKVEIGK